MRSITRSSTESFDGGGHSFVQQTTDMINRFRNSFVRSRKQRLVDEDIQAADNLVNEIHLTELIAKETWKKLVMQGDSMQRSYGLINQLQKEIKDIAEDLNEVQQTKFFGLCSNRRRFDFSLFGCIHNRRKQMKKKQKRNINYGDNNLKEDHLKSNENSSNSFNFVYRSSTEEREVILNRIQTLAKERREHVDFLNLMKLLNETKNFEKENDEKKLNKLRDYLLEHHPFLYGYIDQPERLTDEIDLAIHFDQLDQHLDNLLELTTMMNNEIDKHNLIITKIGVQAMESGDLLMDYTSLGHHILGSSPNSSRIKTINQPLSSNLDHFGISPGQKLLLNAVI